MVKAYQDDTIAAIATPIGEGAIAVIRVSGKNAISAIDTIFEGRTKLAEAGGYTAHYGKLVDTIDGYIDDVIVTVYREPHSYTGENAVEVSCHGGIYNTQKVLTAILSTGVRPAEPGEFTKRAFLNGKMDLSQAEAVADLIASRSEASYRASLNQLEGRFSGQIREMRNELLNLCSLLELELDFSEEGVELVPRKEVLERISRLRRQMKQMMDSYRVGKLYREGVSVAIVGKPNAGKSSLFNALLSENRAIVTEIPGTTRDSLEENISLDGILFRLNDTAGLRETTDPIELEGVFRSERLSKEADVLLYVIDASLNADRLDGAAFVEGTESPRSVIVAYNKIDLCSQNGFSTRQYEINGRLFSEVYVSARSGTGLDELRKTLLERVAGSKIEAGEIQLTNKRHFDALQSSSDLLQKAYGAVEAGSSGEFIASDVSVAADSLAEIVGEISTDDMLNNIFSHFCIGK